MRTDFVHATSFALALAAIVYSFWLVLATFSFWFIKAENILVIFQSMYSTGKYPVAIYPRWLKMAMTFLVPVAFAVTVPSEALLGRPVAGCAVGGVGNGSGNDDFGAAVLALGGTTLFGGFGLIPATLGPVGLVQEH